MARQSIVGTAHELSVEELHVALKASADEKKKRPLIEGNKEFLIPNYQREFSWGSNEIRDFLFDVQQHRHGSTYYHFLGNIFLHNDSTKSTRLYVLDGQQRMTAIQLHCIALLDLCQQKEIKLEEQKKLAQDNGLNDSQIKAIEKEASRISTLITRLKKIIFVHEDRSDVDKCSLRLEGSYEKAVAIKLAITDPGMRYQFAMQGLKLPWNAWKDYKVYLNAFVELYNDLVLDLTDRISTRDPLDPTTAKSARTKHLRDIRKRAEETKEGVRKTFDVIDNRKVDVATASLESATDELLNARVVGTRLKDKPEAWYVTFEALNSRGLSLDASEKIKNSLFAAATAAGADLGDIETRWGVVLDHVRKREVVLDFDTIIHFCLICFYDKSCKKDNIAAYLAAEFKSTSTTISSGTPTPSFEKFLKILEDVVTRLATKTKASTNEAVARRNMAFDGLRRLGDQYAWLPVVATAEAELDQDLTSLLEISESFAFRHRKVLKAPRKQTAFQNTLKNSAEGLRELIVAPDGTLRVDPAEIARFKSECARLAPDAEVTEKFQDNKSFCATTPALQFYVLWRLNYAEFGQMFMLEGHFDEKHHVEHIYPKKPADGVWDAMKKYHPGGSVFKDDSGMREIFISDFGNLTLLEPKINMAIKNKGIVDKVGAPGGPDDRECYSDSEIAMVNGSGKKRPKHRLPRKDLVSFATAAGGPGPSYVWTADLIKERHGHLSAYLDLAWVPLGP